MVFYSAARLRAMYAGGRADPTARRWAHLWAVVFGLGLQPRRWITLEVAGRRSGVVRRFPLGMADWQHHWYLVSMLGEHCDWVRNVRAADGQVVLRHRRGRACRLVEVPVAERAPILRSYLHQVPGARPHVPVNPDAPVSEFEAIAARYPVFQISTAQIRPRRTGKRHWVRWLLAGVAALVVLVVVLVEVFVQSQGGPTPLTLPAQPASAPSGDVQGTWTVAAGSTAGFRVRETVLFAGNDVVYRTNAVTGTLNVTGGSVTTATFRVDLTTLTYRGTTQPQVATSLDTAHHPDATFDLTRPIALTPGTTTADGRLTLRGVSRQVTFTITGRQDGATLQAVGSIPVTFADFGIQGPGGLGPLGSLADHGTAEFLVILQHT